MKTLIAIIIVMAVSGCHLSARADIFYKDENGGQIHKSRGISSSPRNGSGNATDAALRDFFNTKGGRK